MKTILLTQNKEAVVDDSDYLIVSQYKWYAKRDCDHWYAARNLPTDESGRRGTQRMHQLILAATHGFTVDHIDGNTLNNQRGNLRQASKRQQKLNSTRMDGKFKGIQKQSNGKCLARIIVNGRNYYLGMFGSEAEAARAYNQAALLHFGEFARLNEIK